MARKVGVVLSAILAFSLHSAAQNSGVPESYASPAASAPVKTGTAGLRPKMMTDDERRAAQLAEFQRTLEQMSPDQRQKFGDNLKRWQELPQDERRYLKEQQGFMQGKMAQEAQESIRQSGLQLDPDRKEVYALRYMQERRKIEEKLRRQMEIKRKQLLDEMTSRLKAEFSVPLPGATPTPGPRPSPSSIPATSPKTSAPARTEASATP